MTPATDRADLVVAVQTSVDQVASRLGEIETSVERQVAGIGEQLSVGLARVHEQMAAEQVAAAARSEQVCSAVQARVVDQFAHLGTKLTVMGLLRHEE